MTVTGGDNHDYDHDDGGGGRRDYGDDVCIYRQDLSFSYWWDPHSEDDDALQGRYEAFSHGEMQPGERWWW
jgi:hypothetical protein